MRIDAQGTELGQVRERLAGLDWTPAGDTAGRLADALDSGAGGRRLAEFAPRLGRTAAAVRQRTGAPQPRPDTVVGPVTIRIGDRHTLMGLSSRPPARSPAGRPGRVLAALDLVADEATGTLRLGRGVRI